MLGEQSNISSVLSVAVRCLVKCWIRLTTLSSLLDSCMLSFIKFRKCTPRNNLNTKQASCLHRRGHETLEMLDGMVYSFYQPKQSSNEQGRAKASKVVRCSVKCWIRMTMAKPVVLDL